MAENIRLSLRGIASHKLRSFLTMLGIIIGIAAIIAIVSIIKGTNQQIEDNLIGDGTHTVTVRLYQDGWPVEFAWGEVPGNITAFDASVREELLALENVEMVSMYRSRENGSGSAFYKNNDLSSCSVYGVDPYYFQTKGMQIVKGRGISESDIKNFRKVCVIDTQTVSAAFSDTDPIGATIDISGEPFTVVGVAAKKSVFQPVINSIADYYTYSQTSSGMICIPIENWPTLYRYDEPQSFLVKASDTKAMTTVGKDAADLLNGKFALGEDAAVAFQSNDLAAEAAKLQQLSSSTNVMLVGIALISLLVGGIGVMNIMLVSVTERTREIGLKKALGAKKRTIRGQFLTEAAMLSVLGGILGVAVGIILAKIISQIAQVPTAISVPAILVSVGFSMVIGIVFGLVPSVKASNLNPIDALRYE